MFTYKNVIYINVHFHWANLKAKFSYHTQNLIFKLVIKKVLSAECTLIFIISNKRRWKVALLIQFMPQVSFYIPLKTSENFWFSDIFRGYRKRPLPWNGLIVCQGFWKNFFFGIRIWPWMKGPEIKPVPTIKDCLQISPLLLSRFKRIN